MKSIKLGSKPDPLSFGASALVRDVTAILTALLQGRESCEGRVHFKLEPRRPVKFRIMVGEPMEDGDA